jgi:homoserine O-acetyltransferase/O-succinyltransferase
VPANTPYEGDVHVGPMTLEAGAHIPAARLRLWTLGPHSDQAALAAGSKLPAFPTVVVVHPLTASACVTGADGFWNELVGKGCALRPWAERIISFNQLGSCFGSFGPSEVGFPSLVEDRHCVAAAAPARGDLHHDLAVLPATVTTWDQARAVLAGLDRLGVDEVALVVGGSTGGMVAQCLGALAPQRFRKVMSIAAPHASTAWMIAHNHLGREAMLSDPAFPMATTGLALARQLARLSYRAPEHLQLRQGRLAAGPRHVGPAEWSSLTPYRIETYLRHHGDAFAFHPLSYWCLTRAMDHHDLQRSRLPLALDGVQCTNVRISSDGLVTAAASARLSEVWRAAGAVVHDEVLDCPHGHDGFLAAQTALGQLVRRALVR